MASLFNHPKSKFWYIQFKTCDGRVRRQSTKILKGSADARRKALQIVAEVTAKELSRNQNSSSEKWDAWVVSFLEMRHAGSNLSRIRELSRWKGLRIFLKERGLDYPAQVRYHHGAEYMAWRMEQGYHHNGARQELITLGMLIKEAVKRGFISASPMQGLGIKKLPPKEKPELTDEDIACIREALKAEPEWMRTSFEIALHTGCRVRETRIALADIDFAKRLIAFRAPKGGSGRAFTAKFPSALLPLFRRLKAEGREYTLEFPHNNKRWPDVASIHWHRFFKKKGLKLSDPDITFHSTRVTYASRHARKGTEERIVMKQMNHGSTLVHRIYSRLRAEDLSDADLDIGLPSAPCDEPILKPPSKEVSRQPKGARATSSVSSVGRNTRLQSTAHSS